MKNSKKCTDCILISSKFFYRTSKQLEEFTGNASFCSLAIEINGTVIQFRNLKMEFILSYSQGVKKCIRQTISLKTFYFNEFGIHIFSQTSLFQKKKINTNGLLKVICEFTQYFERIRKMSWPLLDKMDTFNIAERWLYNTDLSPSCPLLQFSKFLGVCIVAFQLI